ncbi:MAG: site-2 protease family protein [Coriobacteriia bacterium]|nr:site-2 protease family protein [Coriobacteriia bacterium]
MNDFTYTIISLLCFIPSIMVHEVSHGYAALKLGDTTAKDANRLTFNPLKHIDPFGTVILPLLLALSGLPPYGYAKAVPFNPRRLKDPKTGELIIALAGPTSNLILALAASVIAYFVRHYGNWRLDFIFWAYTALYAFTVINLCLMFFNLLPIPPLDGASVFAPFIPDDKLQGWYKLQRQALPILFFLIIGLPYVFRIFGINFNPLQAYIQATAGNLSRFLFGF